MSRSPRRLSGLNPDRRALLDTLLKEEGWSSVAIPTILRRQGGGSPPLSFAQQRLWILDQFQPGSSLFSENFALRLEVPLLIPILERSINEIVRRHEALRTTFVAVEGEPVQVIAPELKVPLEVVDLRALGLAEREREVERLATEEARRPFDLAKGPLIRTTLLRLGSKDHVFLLNMHHIISDGWSMTVFSNELTKLYAAFSMGRPSPLPELPIQYADFALWQRGWLAGEVLKGQLAYWERQLAAFPALRLPTDRPRSGAPTFEGAFEWMTIPREAMDALKALGEREGTTRFMTLLAAFKVLLLRYCGQEDIVVGAPIANRNRAEIEPLIGFFVNMLVMRTDLSGNPTFREALRRIKEVALGAYAHQDLPFEKLVEELQPERDLAKNPLFQVSFQWLQTPEPVRGDTGVDTRPIEIQRGTANVDLAFDVYEGSKGTGGIRIEYSTELFDVATIQRMTRHFQVLLGGIIAHPDEQLSKLPLLTEGERRQMLVEWNDTAAGYPTGAPVHELFESQAERTPDAVAVRYESRRMSYRELDRRSNQLARHLEGLGVGPESLVGVCVERSPEMVVALLGVLKAGGAYVPLDPTYPKERLAFMLGDTGAGWLLTQGRLVSQLPAHEARLVQLDGDQEAIARQRETAPATVVSAGDLAYVIYTSGSTGTPKGVMVTHRGLSNHMSWLQSALALNETDRMVQKYSLSFDVATLEIFAPLLAGAQLVLARSERYLDPAYLLKLMADEKVTIIDLVPSLLGLLLEEEGMAACGDLRRVCCGGEVLPIELQERFFEATDAELHNLYGPTEATIGSTIWTCKRDLALGTVPIGRPIANTQAYVLDRHLNPAPIGVPGELHLGGAGLARGYLNQPELTAERFVPHPFDSRPGARLYKTGDLVRYLPDGNLEFLGRMDRQVKIRGFRIELGEIEASLKEHPGVRDAAVVIAAHQNGSMRSRSDGVRDEPVRQLLNDALLSLSEGEADRIFRELERLTEPETEFLLRYEKDGDERRRTMLQRCPEFEVFLRMQDPDFISPPREGQRNWILRRALDELADDLRHLDALSKRFVAGSDRAPILNEWGQSHARYDSSQLVIQGQQVMQEWERPLMKAMADVAAETHGDVLEIGFGMGISATYIQERGVRSHTIVECNDEVIEAFQAWRGGYPDRDIRLLPGNWQEVVDRSGAYDGVFFDAYPTDENEFEATVINSITFAENFVPTAAAALRDGGVFTYYTNEIDSFSRRHQRLIFQHFRSLDLNVVRSLRPPDDCNYWWADSMVVARAVK